MPTRRMFCILFFSMLLLICTTGLADTVRLKNGDILTGRIIKRTEDSIELETDYGVLTIPVGEIESILESDGSTRQKDRPRETGTPPAKRSVSKPTAELGSLRRKARKHMRSKEWAEAVEVFKQILEKDPTDSSSLYNCACAYALLGKKKEAVEYLVRSVEAGYIDFAHIEADPDLDSIRGEEGYKNLIIQKETYLSRHAEKTVEKYKKLLGDEYTVKKDDQYKLVIVSNVSAEYLERLVSSLRAFAECHWKDFFKFKPQYYITVLIPRTRRDYIEKFNGRSSAGFYRPDTKTLTVNLSTGTGTMIHEFTHALHYADMEGLGQRHPIWIVEGFGTLYEQCTRRDDGSGYGLLNWRLPGLKKAIKSGKCMKVRDLIENSGSCFRTKRSLAYAMARYIFYFLQEKKLLRKWYARYRENYDDDKSGLKTLEEIYGKSVEEFEKEWLEFLKPLEYKRRRARPDAPYMGVRLEDTKKGLKIAEVVEDSPAEKAGMRAGDIIMKVDGNKVVTLSDLRSIMEKKKVGEEISVIVERNGEEKELNLKLGKRP